MLPLSMVLQFCYYRIAAEGVRNHGGGRRFGPEIFHLGTLTTPKLIRQRGLMGVYYEGQISEEYSYQLLESNGVGIKGGC